MYSRGDTFLDLGGQGRWVDTEHLYEWSTLYITVEQIEYGMLKTDGEEIKRMYCRYIDDLRARGLYG